MARRKEDSQSVSRRVLRWKTDEMTNDRIQSSDVSRDTPGLAGARGGAGRAPVARRLDGRRRGWLPYGPHRDGHREGEGQDALPGGRGAGVFFFFKQKTAYEITV